MCIRDRHLASQKKNVALLLCDMTAPMMPCICPPSELECDKSLEMCIRDSSTYKAVILAADCHDIAAAVRIAENLDDYLIEPDQRTPEEVRCV